MPDPTCATCRAPLPPREPGRPGRTRRYCSKSCANRAAYKRRVAAGWDRGDRSGEIKRKTANCAWCDRTYTTSRLQGRYCSNHCASYGNGQAALRSDLTWRHCKHCDRPYLHGLCPLRASHPTQEPPDMSPRPCDSCGTPFTPTRPSGYFAIYCSRKCNRRETHARRRAAGGEADHYRTDRAIGRVRRWAIYERDQWRCQLCGRKVNKDVEFPDPMSASLDHIVPVSLGGAHEEANLQLAHFGCNSRKRNKVNGDGEQLRLAV